MSRSSNFSEIPRFYVGFADSDSVPAWVRETALDYSLINRNI